MIQVRVFSSSNKMLVQDDANKFLATLSDSSVVDVKFSSAEGTFDILVTYKS
ncbi:sporulation protein Cse60 [Paenibacillus oryzisoli]|uniref:sporulation protein Cse60 n=1 Tax=Paenibacillus oryzisoli TaxID=1850517 RepID=UPI0009ED7D7C